MLQKNIILKLLLVSFLSTAAYAADSPSDSEQQAAVAQQEAMMRGAVAWGNTCTRCHNLREPREFTDQQWRSIMLHMRIRAGLTGGDARDILSFIQMGNN